MKDSRPIRIALCVVLATLCSSACAKDSYAARGAAGGAKRGAAAGAVAGAVGALIWGGDPITGAAAGAAMGSASGATSGAMAGGEIDRERDHARAAKRAKDEARARRELGPDAFASLEALAECHHDQAIRHATKARESKNPNYAVSGLWVEALTYADADRAAQAQELFPVIVQQDWEIEDEAAAENFLHRLQATLGDVRTEYDLPTSCEA